MQRQQKVAATVGAVFASCTAYSLHQLVRSVAETETLNPCRMLGQRTSPLRLRHGRCGRAAAPPPPAISAELGPSPAAAAPFRTPAGVPFRACAGGAVVPGAAAGAAAAAAVLERAPEDDACAVSSVPCAGAPAASAASTAARPPEAGR